MRLHWAQSVPRVLGDASVVLALRVTSGEEITIFLVQLLHGAAESSPIVALGEP